MRPSYDCILLILKLTSGLIDRVVAAGLAFRDLSSVRLLRSKLPPPLPCWPVLQHHSRWSPISAYILLGFLLLRLQPAPSLTSSFVIVAEVFVVELYSVLLYLVFKQGGFFFGEYFLEVLLILVYYTGTLNHATSSGGHAIMAWQSWWMAALESQSLGLWVCLGNQEGVRPFVAPRLIGHLTLDFLPWTVCDFKGKDGIRVLASPEEPPIY